MRKVMSRSLQLHEMERCARHQGSETHSHPPLKLRTSSYQMIMAFSQKCVKRFVK